MKLIENISTLTATLLLLGAISSSASANNAQRPNIIFVLADDISAKDLALNSTKGISVPTLSKMAAEGINFKTAWANAVCGPSRAVLQTGKYPFNQNHFANPAYSNIPMWKEHKLIGENMRELGYATGMYGKLHFLDTWKDQDPTMYGFDEYAIPKLWPGFDGEHQLPAGKRTKGMYATSWFWHPGMVINGKGIKTTKQDFGPEIEFDEMEGFIKRNKNKPFFAYWSTYLPHMAHTANMPMNKGWYYTDVPELDEDFNWTGRKIHGSLASNMHYLDQKLEQLISVLKEQNILDNTIIFVVGDNGTPAYGKGRYESEVAIHVPFIVWSPSLVKQRGNSDVLVDFTDIYPTLTELAGGEVAAEIDGHSLAPYLLDQDFTPREWIFMQYDDRRWLRTNRWLLDANGHLYDTRDELDESAGYIGLKLRKPLRTARKDPNIGYKDVTFSPEYKEIRIKLEKISRQFPGPNFDHPDMAAGWKRWQTGKKKQPAFVPDYLKEK